MDTDEIEVYSWVNPIRVPFCTARNRTDSLNSKRFSKKSNGIFFVARLIVKHTICVKQGCHQRKMVFCGTYNVHVNGLSPFFVFVDFVLQFPAYLLLSFQRSSTMLFKLSFNISKRRFCLLC